MSRIRKLREEQELSIHELSRRSGVSRPAIRALERGQSVPKIETVRRISGALERKPSEVFPELWLPDLDR